MSGLFIPKSQFFDRKKIIDSMDRTTHAVFSRFGAFVRRRAQTSMRYKDGPSKVGTPPNAHRAFPLLRKHIYFYFDEDKKTVVIGAALLTGGAPYAVPGMLENGGSLPTHINPRRKVYKIGDGGPVRIGGGGRTFSVRDYRGKVQGVRYVKLHTARQVQKANDNATVLFGPPTFTGAVMGPRPFIKPAAEKELSALPGLWSNSIKG